MRILVIGGTGFIGSKVVDHLSQLGHEVAVFHRGKSEPQSPSKALNIHGDRHDLERCADEFRSLSPQVVVDMVPLQERDALTVVGAFSGVAECLVSISSQDVYKAYGLLIGIESGPLQTVPLTEDAALRETLFPYLGKTPRNADDRTGGWTRTTR